MGNKKKDPRAVAKELEKKLGPAPDIRELVRGDKSKRISTSRSR